MNRALDGRTAVCGLLACVTLLSWTTAGRAVQMVYDLHPVFQQEYAVSGSPSSGGSSSVFLYWGSTGETRGAYEYLLPQLPAGSVITDASMDVFLWSYTRNSTTSAEATFHAYSGDGVFSTGDVNVPTNYVARTGSSPSTGAMTIDFNQTYLSNLYTQGATHLGLMAWQEHYGQSMDIGRGADSPFDFAPTVHMTVNSPDTIAGLINGDFGTGNLYGWESYLTENGSVSPGLPAVEIFDVTGSGGSDAVKFKVGLDPYVSGTYGGGGIRQTFTLDTPGQYVFSADIASFNNDISGNTGPGKFDLILDGEVIGTTNLTGTLINPGQTIRDTLEGTAWNLAAGAHTLAVQVTRSATNSRDIFQYIDNISMAISGEEPPATTTSIIEPTFDVQWEKVDGIASISDGATGLIITHYPNDDERAVMEFDLSEIPINAVILSATLTIDAYSSSGSNIQMGLHGYAGDGVASIADGQVPFNLIGITPPMNASTQIDPIPLDVAYIQSLIGEASHLGIMMYISNAYEMLAIYASEVQNVLLLPPTLTIEWQVFHPGDANGDGLVNLADLQILGDNWMSGAAGWTTADFNGDGTVNLADLQILGDNWGFGVSSDLAFDEALLQMGINIPEPGALAMAMLSMCGCLRRAGARAAQR